MSMEIGDIMHQTFQVCEVSVEFKHSIRFQIKYFKSIKHVIRCLGESSMGTLANNCGYEAVNLIFIKMIAWPITTIFEQSCLQLA